MKTKHKYLFDAYEEIDAAMFSGDTYEDAEEREELRRLMARWERGLIAAEEFEAQFKAEQDAGNEHEDHISAKGDEQQQREADES